MVDKTKLTIGTIITLVMLLSGTYYIAQDDDAYYCESKDLVMICEKLSSGLGTRCYFEDTYKICSEGWKKLDNEVVLSPEVPISSIQQGNQYLCSPQGCEPLE